MTLLALNAVQPALYTKLTGDGVLMGMITAVYDAPPQAAILPYVVIGDGAATQAPQLVNQLTQCQLELHVWTAGSGRKTALTILNRLYGLLHHASLSISGFSLVVMEAGNAQTQVDAQEDRAFGVLNVTVTVSEP